MILDRTWNRRKRQLTVSYIDKEGHRKFIEQRFGQFPTYVFDEAGKLTNWDGRKISPTLQNTETYKPSEFDILEWLYKHPLRDEFAAIRKPRLYTADIETEISDEFPEPELAEQRVTTISVAADDLSVIVLGIRPFTEEQLEKFRTSYLEYIKGNEFAAKHCDISKIRVLYQYFPREEDMLKHFFEKMIPKMEVLAGWNFHAFDWVYLCNRCIRLFGEREARSMLYRASITGEVTSERCINNKGEEFRITIPAHTAVMDYMRLVEKYDRTLDNKESLSLDWIAHASVGANKIKYAGDLQQLYNNDYDKYVFYNAVDSLLIQLINKRLKTLEVMFVYSSFTFCSLMRCLSPVALTTALMFEDFYNEGHHVVWEEREIPPSEDFDGGYVKDPTVGFHSWLVCDDFASLYPSQIITCNLSMENYMQKYVTGYDGTKCYVPWSEEELDKYRSDPNYFVTVLGHVYKNDKDYAFKRMQMRTKQKRAFYKYRGQLLESELLNGPDGICERIKKLEHAS